MSKTDKYIPGQYWERRLSKDFSLTGVGHLGFQLEYNIWLYKARLHVLGGLLKEKNVNCRGKKLLDIGVGTGFYVNFWEELGVKDITGIDITTKAVEELEKKYPDYRFIKADISKAELPLDEKFDVITGFDVFFHIVEDSGFEQAIKNLKKLSHKETIILIMDNFLKEYKAARGHENDRTLEYYEKILSSNSIGIEDIRPLFYFMNTPIDIERISGRLLKFLIKWVWWTNRAIMGCCKKLGALGRGITYFWALTLYYFDRIILKCTFVGPSTKLLLAKLSPSKNEL